MITTNLILSTIYFLLPAYFANMAPVFAMRLGILKRLNIPIDHNYSLFGQRILGAGKTWRGLLSGFIAALIICAMQSIIQSLGWLSSWTVIDYNYWSFIFIAFLTAIGALGGDLLKSFLKRRFKIDSGQPWPLFDQLDFILGYLGIMALIMKVTTPLFWSAILITLILHPLTNIAGYLLKIKKVWW